MKFNDDISISDSGFVFDARTGDSFSLNSTAIEILNLLRNGRTSVEIEEYFTTKYDISQELFKRHLDDYLQMLHHYQVIKNA